MTHHRRLLIAAGAALLAFPAGYAVRVLAEGAPTKQQLFYSGTLEADGSLANGTYTVALALYDAASGGKKRCAVSAEAAVENGRFRIDASECASALQKDPDTWVAVSFEDSDGVAHDVPGRSKVGAVPYALEANHAVEASAPTGELATTLQKLESRIGVLEQAAPAASAFSALKTTEQMIDAAGSYVIFDDEQFDLGDEYDKESGVFTAKTAGHYEFWCHIVWLGADHTTLGQFEAGLHVNGAEWTFSGQYGDGVATTRDVHGIIQLAAGDEMRCGALQEGAGSLPLNIGSDGYNSFSGHRLPY